jgi:hypothetical protein
MKRNSKSIQDFWMLVEMGDLSRPDDDDMDNEDDDMDSAVFDIEDEKSNPGFSQSVFTGAGAGAGGSKKESVSRCESAPALSSTNVKSPLLKTSHGDNTKLSSSATNNTDSNHDAVILQSLLSMASAEHLRIDNIQAHTSTPSASASGGEQNVKEEKE